MKDINATIIIPLKGKTEEELFNSAEYSRRKNVKKAIRSGLTLFDINSRRELERCYKLHSEILKTGGSTPVPKEEWFARIEREKQKYFAVMYKNEQVGYMSVMDVDGDYYNSALEGRGIRPRVFAADSKYKDFRVMDFIYWSTILYALKNGYDFVDLGGYQLNARGHLQGVNRFKEQWGGKLFKFYKNYSFFKAIGRKLVRSFYLVWYFNNLLKGRKETYGDNN